MECLLTIPLLILKYRTLDRTLLEKYNKFESCGIEIPDYVLYKNLQNYKKQTWHALFKIFKTLVLVVSFAYIKSTFWPVKYKLSGVFDIANSWTSNLQIYPWLPKY